MAGNSSAQAFMNALNNTPSKSSANSGLSTAGNASVKAFTDALNAPTPAPSTSASTQTQTSTGMPQSTQPHDSWWRSLLSDVSHPMQHIAPEVQKLVQAHPQTGHAVLDALTNASNAMSGISNVIPNQVNDWVNSIQNHQLSAKDIPLEDTVSKFLQGFNSSPYSLNQNGDIQVQQNPVLRGLENAGKNSADFGTLFNNLGWKYHPNQAWYTPHNLARGGASFTADMVTNPANALTFGAGNLAKVGADAMGKAAADVAKGAGVDVAKGAAGDVATGTAKNVFEKAIQSGKSPQEAKALHDAAFNDIINAGKAARAKAQNSLVNLDVPFTNKTASLAEKPGFLKPTEQPIQAHSAQAVQDMFNSRGYTSGAQQAKVMQKLYGVKNASDLKPQQFEDLLNRLSTLPVKNVEPQTGVPAFDNLNQPSSLQALQDITTPQAEIPAPTQADISQLTEQPFVADAAGQSALGRLGDKVFGKMKPRNGEGGNTIWDTQSRILGQRKDMANQIKRLNKEYKTLTPTEKKLINYLGENKLPPEGYLTEAELKALNGAHRPIMDRVAQEMRRIYEEEIAQPELQAGTLTPELQRENYMYHMLNPNSNLTEEQLKAIQENPYQNISTLNKSNQERKGFQTFAEHRAAIDKLQNALSHVTDPAEKAKIEERLNVLQNLYEPDAMTALTKRWSNSIRTRNYKQMFNELQMQGLVRQSGDMPAELAQNFDKLALKDERNFAKKAGLPVGSFVHKEVLSGLKKVDKLFNPDQFGKWLGNINAVSNIWKALPIIYNPAHLHVRLIGDVSNAMLGGATLKDFTHGLRLTKAIEKGTATAEQKKLYDTIINEGILRDHAGENAVVHQKFYSQDVSPKLQDFENKVQNNPLGRSMSGILNHMDNQSRLALFLAGMRKTGNAKQASDLVRKFLFNYNELSGPDKLIQTLVPFWTWTRNNIPLMVEQLGKQPRYFEAYNQFQAQTQGNHPTYPYAQDFLHLKGNYFENLRLPMSDLNAFDQPGNEAINMLSPINPLVLLGEQQANKDYFTGMPIDKYAIPGNPASTKSMLGYTAQQALPGIFANIMRDSGNKHSWQYNLFNGLVGGLSNQNPAKIAKNNAWIAKEKRLMETKKLKAKG